MVLPRAPKTKAMSKLTTTEDKSPIRAVKVANTVFQNCMVATEWDFPYTSSPNGTTIADKLTILFKCPATDSGYTISINPK